METVSISIYLRLRIPSMIVGTWPTEAVCVKEILAKLFG